MRRDRFINTNNDKQVAQGPAATLYAKMQAAARESITAREAAAKESITAREAAARKTINQEESAASVLLEAKENNARKIVAREAAAREALQLEVHQNNFDIIHDGDDHLSRITAAGRGIETPTDDEYDSCENEGTAAGMRIKTPTDERFELIESEGLDAAAGSAEKTGTDKNESRRHTSQVSRTRLLHSSRVSL